MNLQNRAEHAEIGKSLSEELSIKELISQLMHYSKGIDRLGIKPYVWWNEALHGVARAGIATVFPQSICYRRITFLLSEISVRNEKESTS